MSTSMPGEHSGETHTPGDDGSATTHSTSTPNEAAIGVDRTQAVLTALDLQGRSGANWFYWVAALSIVNSAMLLSGANRHFVVGLAVTQFIDGFGMAIAQQAPEHTRVIYAVTFGFNLVIAFFVAGFAWLSKRRVPAVFLIGMILYALDGLLFILFEDWMSAAFHAYALYGMWSGWSAYRKLAAIEAGLPWNEGRVADEELAPVVE